MTGLEKLVLMTWIIACAKLHGGQPDFALAVAHVESRSGKQEFRIGRVGKFFLPFGIHKDYARKWPHLDLWPVQVYWATKRLAQFTGREKEGLKKWNTEFNQAYWLAVKGAWEKYKKKL